MDTSIKSSVQRLVQILQGYGITVVKAAMGETRLKLVVAGAYDELPAYIKARCRGFPDGDNFAVFIRRRDIHALLNGPPKRRGRIERVKIGGHIVESELVTVRIPGIAFDGQFTLENDGGSGTVPYGKSAGSPHKLPPRRG